MSTSTRAASYGTHWVRTLALFTVGLAAMAGLFSAAKLEVMAQQIVFQDTTAKFSASTVTGEDIGFGTLPMKQRVADGSNTTDPVLRAGFAKAEINGFCLTQQEKLPAIGWVTLTVTAGDGDPETMEIAADNLVIDVLGLRGDDRGINLDGVVQIGVTTSDITTVGNVDNPLGAPTNNGGAGWFGIDADKGEIFNAKGTLYDAVIGGPAALPNLSLNLTPGEGPHCDTMPLPN